MNKSATRALIPLVVFAALAALLFWGLGQDPREIPSPLLDKPAPTFSLETLQNASTTLDRTVLLGKVSLVNIWASWCPSCREEHGELMRIAREDGVQMIGLNWKDTRPEALRTLEELGNPYSVILYDPDNKAGIDWGVYGAPETFIVDRQGIIRHKRTGPITPQVWEQELLPIIQQLKAKQS